VVGLIDAPNTMPWRVVDFVIHDAYTELADMLTVGTGCSRNGIHWTRSAFPAEQTARGAPQSLANHH